MCRRLIIPEDAGYPNGDYKNFQPSPTTFAVCLLEPAALCLHMHNHRIVVQMSNPAGCLGSASHVTKCGIMHAEYICPVDVQGNRTLDFVLKSKGFIDKTLLIDIELLKVS